MARKAIYRTSTGLQPNIYGLTRYSFCITAINRLARDKSGTYVI